MYIDFNDERIPIGKRKVAYVKWAISKGTDKITAMKQANKKFGFERKGKYLALIGNADFMDLPSMRDYSWERAAQDAGCPDPRRCESVIILCDSTYAPFEISGNTTTHKHDLSWQNYSEWAAREGYVVKGPNWICP